MPECEKKNRTNDDAVASSGYGARFGLRIARLNKLFRQPKEERKRKMRMKQIKKE